MIMISNLHGIVTGSMKALSGQNENKLNETPEHQKLYRLQSSTTFQNKISFEAIVPNFITAWAIMVSFFLERVNQITYYKINGNFSIAGVKKEEMKSGK